MDELGGSSSSVAVYLAFTLADGDVAGATSASVEGVEGDRVALARRSGSSTSMGRKVTVIDTTNLAVAEGESVDSWLPAGVDGAIFSIALPSLAIAPLPEEAVVLDSENNKSPIRICIGTGVLSSAVQSSCLMSVYAWLPQDFCVESSWQAVTATMDTAALTIIDVPVARYSFAAVATVNRVFIFGGIAARQTVLRHTEWASGVGAVKALPVRNAGKAGAALGAGAGVGAGAGAAGGGGPLTMKPPPPYSLTTLLTSLGLLPGAMRASRNGESSRKMTRQ